MTQQAPQTKTRDGLVLEISSSLCQPSTISQLLFSCLSKREAARRDLELEGEEKSVKE